MKKEKKIKRKIEYSSVNAWRLYTKHEVKTDNQNSHNDDVPSFSIEREKMFN